MASEYVPPVQKGFGQLVDSLFLLVLVYCSLLAPLLLKAPDKQPDAAQAVKTQVSWQTLGQNPTMQAQWQKLGFDAGQAKPIITTRFDYTVDPASLIVTAVVIVGYFVFVLRVSDRQYRQVIAEKFSE
ncbi:hypothetical protein VSR34_15635 [Paraburkholderia sp. JHI2823]|uniref:hypothetical protein n=1 Tax=Paraburkholderia TaxID=1822464 RepID=UPI000426D91B|nr:hypothetical protein [Paraburkholderia mimosarum]